MALFALKNVFPYLIQYNHIHLYYQLVELVSPLPRGIDCIFFFIFVVKHETKTFSPPPQNEVRVILSQYTEQHVKYNVKTTICFF